MTTNPKLFNLEKLIEFRHWMHQNAELSQLEHNTQQKIREYLISLGIPSQSIRTCAETGLIIDIFGKDIPKDKPLLIGIRAELDALPLQENNSLPYKSTTNVSHMCGHDGHVACQLGGLSLYLENLDEIPSNRGVRFQLQPGEEGFFGAKKMIEDGAIIGLDEIYGLHNWPIKEFAGKILCKVGDMMAGAYKIHIKIIGRGGHGSRPDQCMNPVPISAEINIAQTEILDEYMEKYPNLKASIPMLVGSKAFNIIPENVIIEGTIRFFEETIANEILEKLSQTSHKIANDKGFKVEFSKDSFLFKAVKNHSLPVDWVKKAVKEVYGSDNFYTEEKQPVYGSEDFSEYTEHIPGAFFLTAHGINDPNVTLHSQDFLFDDKIIEPISKLWQKLIQLRLKS